MSYNENGLLVDTFTVYDYHSKMSEGAVVGIVLGWFFWSYRIVCIGNANYMEML